MLTADCNDADARAVTCEPVFSFPGVQVFRLAVNLLGCSAGIVGKLMATHSLILRPDGRLLCSEWKCQDWVLNDGKRGSCR